MLYERIKELCRQNGTSINALEKDCGFGRGSISKIDKHKPSNEKLQKIAEYLGVTVDQLTGVQTDVQHDGYDIIFRDGYQCHCRTKKDVRTAIVEHCR